MIIRCELCWDSQANPNVASRSCSDGVDDVENAFERFLPVESSWCC
jgi:hypothetical protein